MLYGVEFDVVGQSYYPWWHGTLLDLRDNMYFMAKEYKKSIILVEVAYCSSRDFFDEEGNVLPVITVFDKYTRH